MTVHPDCHNSMVTLDPRDKISETLLAVTPTEGPCMLQGWIVVYEWSEMNGKRWLHIVTGSDASSNHYITEWQISGYLTEALNGEWQPADEAEG